MDLGRAMSLAGAGRPQAPESYAEETASGLAGSSEPSLEPESDGASEGPPVRVPEPPDLSMTKAEWYGHVNNVARGLAERLTDRHWYDLREAEREEMRELAVHAMLAVGSADIAFRQRRMESRLEERVHQRNANRHV